MARMRDKKSAKRVTIPGMSGVEGRVTVAEGEYAVQVAEVTQEEGSAAPYLKWKFEITSKVHKGAFLFYNTSLAPQALWNLRGLLEAMQCDIPDDDTDMDASEFVGLGLMVNVEHDTYEGKKQAKIVDFWPASGAENDGNDEDEKPVKGKKAAPADDEDEKPAVKKSKKADDEDDGDDKASSRQARRRERRAEKKAPAKKEMIAQDEIADMKQDELEDVAEKYGFDIDFASLPTLRKMRNAVIEAAEEAGVLEE